MIKLVEKSVNKKSRKKIKSKQPENDSFNWNYFYCDANCQLMESLLEKNTCSVIELQDILFPIHLNKDNDYFTNFNSELGKNPDAAIKFFTHLFDELKGFRLEISESRPIDSQLKKILKTPTIFLFKENGKTEAFAQYSDGSKLKLDISCGDKAENLFTLWENINRLRSEEINIISRYNYPDDRTYATQPIRFYWRKDEDKYVFDVYLYSNNLIDNLQPSTRDELKNILSDENKGHLPIKSLESKEDIRNNLIKKLTKEKEELSIELVSSIGAYAGIEKQDNDKIKEIFTTSDNSSYMVTELSELNTKVALAMLIKRKYLPVELYRLPGARAINVDQEVYKGKDQHSLNEFINSPENTHLKNTTIYTFTELVKRLKNFDSTVTECYIWHACFDSEIGAYIRADTNDIIELPPKILGGEDVNGYEWDECKKINNGNPSFPKNYNGFVRLKPFDLEKLYMKGVINYSYSCRSNELEAEATDLETKNYIKRFLTTEYRARKSQTSQISTENLCFMENEIERLEKTSYWRRSFPRPRKNHK